MRYSNHGVIIEAHEGWELKATGQLCSTEQCRAKYDRAKKAARFQPAGNLTVQGPRWKERGIAPSRGGKEYDVGNTKDRLWNGGGARPISQGLKTAAGGGGGDDDDGKGYGNGAGGGDEVAMMVSKQLKVWTTRKIRQ